MPVYHNRVTILQKKDLLAGTIPQLRVFLIQQTQYICVQEVQEESI